MSDQFEFVERVQPLEPFTTEEKLVVMLAVLGHPYAEIAKRLHITTASARYLTAQAAAKIPGDLPKRIKLLFWWRGATLEQLVGFDLQPEPPAGKRQRAKYQMF